MPHTFLYFYLQNVVPSKNILSFREDEMFRDPTNSFLLPAYVEDEALALDSWASPLSRIVS
jgi:hypothetical protein